FVAGVASLLDRLVPLQRLPVAEAPEGKFPGLDMLAVVTLGDDLPAGLEDQGPEPELAQLLRGPAAGDAGADHDRVVLPGNGTQELGQVHEGGRARQPSNRPGITMAWVTSFRTRSEVK